MWSDQNLKDSWDNLDDVAYRLRRGNTHYHNTIELIQATQELLRYADRLRDRLDQIELHLKIQPQ